MGFPTTTSHQALKTRLNLTAATQVAVGPGFVYTLAVSASGTCALNDVNGSAAAANLMFTTPATTTAVYQINMPFSQGLLVTPTAGTAAISYES